MTILSSFRRASLLGMLAGGMTLAFAAPSFAGGSIDNPDLRDINSNLSATSGSSLDTNRVVFRANQAAAYYYYGSAENEETPGTYAKGYAFNYDSEAGYGVELTWFAFEPDSVKRTDTSSSLKQKGNIALGVRLTGVSTATETGLVEGCSAKAKIKITDSTKASASLKCPKDVWEDLGFGATEIEAIQETLGSTKIKFGYKGGSPL
ncbi:MAG: hypothetical protein AB8G23_20545 [Myxococcota bacterium]